MNIENHSLLNVSQQAVEQVLFLSNEKNITISNYIKSELGIRADAEMIERVFVNILTNAIKFTPNNGLIVIEAERKSDEEFLRISITDNGIGISADKTQLVFQKFGQVVAKNSGSVRSTGLGLTYCKMVVEAHGGSVGVESEQDNGSKFWFTLPVAQISPEIMTDEKPTIEAKYATLTVAAKAQIETHLAELRNTDFYKITEIIDILSRINDVENEEIKTWKHEVISAIESGNEVLYKNLLQ
jgi:DNA topoisomerase VI subunit B